MDLKLEVLIIPVSDVDRAKEFYDKLGFRQDIDFRPNSEYRIIQLTPPGSEASIIFGKGVTAAQPGSVDRILVAVTDIEAARQELLARGVEISEVFHAADGGLGGGFVVGVSNRAPGSDPQHRSYASYATFSDPDGNRWMLQEIRERLPGRTTHQLVNGRLPEILTDALKHAAAAHGSHEQELGKPDPDWPQWYAGYMARELGRAGYEFMGPTA